MALENKTTVYVKFPFRHPLGLGAYLNIVAHLLDGVNLSKANTSKSINAIFKCLS
jgi:hypothetical protein